jgi:penicillin-insensitive murein endopeptidase
MLRIGRFFLLILLILGLGLAPIEAKKKVARKGKQAVAKVLSPVAKEIFGKQTQPSPPPTMSIGTYFRGCLAGAQPLVITGPAWQVMRPSRNRNWGTPALISYIEQLATDAQKQDGWPGLLVGDLAQPRGGPMLFGHASHQIGLEVDIWLTPMPSRTLTPEERETEVAKSMLAPSGIAVDPTIWTPTHFKLLKRAVSYEQVALIFVNPAIKKALCEAAGDDRKWIAKVHPWWGHDDHFHVRLRCPAGMTSCQNQPEKGGGDGCGKELDAWLKRMGPVKPQPTTPPVQKHPLTIANLPQECAKLVGIEPKGSGRISKK